MSRRALLIAAALAAVQILPAPRPAGAVAPPMKPRPTASLPAPQKEARLAARISVTTIDFLKDRGLRVNGAGPLLMKLDSFRSRLIVANALSSSVSVIDCKSRAVENIALDGRALQHLKSEALTWRKKTGDVYLVGARSFSIAFPDERRSKTIATGVQFESIAVDEETGNAFIAGRESKELGFYSAKSGALAMLPWLATREDLVNLNATPPPPIRKVIAAPELGWIVAVDGYAPAFSVFDARTGKQINSRRLALTAGGRWHLAGYDERGHNLYLVVETTDRRVVEAAKINVVSGEATVVKLPQFTEGVGIVYNPARDEVYIPYDNHPSVHVVDFKRGGEITEIKIPAYGNDGSAVDEAGNTLYVSSWAQGEIDVVDLVSRRLEKRITDLGIIPHMFSLVFDPERHLLYYPKGATAVNGTFGAAVTALDPDRETRSKIYTGWAPVDLVEVPARRSFLVFNSEDEFAEVHPDGTYETHRLPYDYPVEAVLNPDGDVYLSYGPHQSYWPVVYIWGAKDGIITVRAKDLRFYDRRIPEQAHKMVFDSSGLLYFTQNNWGVEEQFLGTLPDGVRLFEIGQRVALGDTVDREITQRILRYDPERNWLYLVRVAEKDTDPSILQVIDCATKKVLRRLTVGRTATDLAFDDGKIYVANFDSKSVTVIDKTSFAQTEVVTAEEPLRLCRAGSAVYVIDHAGRSIEEVRAGGKRYAIPSAGLPDGFFPWRDGLVITCHGATGLDVVVFDPASGRFSRALHADFPYGDTRFDSRNVSFFVNGQFGDALFDISKAATAADGRLWIGDFLSGRVFVLKAE
jgi:YVTN family beta-propeller protein